MKKFIAEALECSVFANPRESGLTFTTRYYLVDTASRPGMSGSPVILRSRNNHVLESSNWVVTDDRKPIDRIIGVYSGRTDDLLGEAQIGMVWHADDIDEIIDHGKIDV